MTTLPDAPEPRISPLRVLLALLLIAALGAAGFLVVRHAVESEARGEVTGATATWFAPYVDTTLTPTYAFQDAAANPSRDVVLGFVVADPKQPCSPSWGAVASLDEGRTAMDLDRRVAQVRGQGGDAIVSFGGQANTELAMACQDVDALTDAYASVVERYSADTVDLDLEGEALSDGPANDRRAAAIKTLQDRVRAGGGQLAVWLTLPVTTSGLRGDSLAVVRTMLAKGVDLAGVNVMAMNLGDATHPTRDMRAGVESSLRATHGQLAAVWAQAGTGLSSVHVWRKLGVTVMIGQNDLDGERFTVADARALREFASEQAMGRVSMWSLNRDRRCGVTFAIVGTHSNLCSGVAQKPLEFTKVFTRLTGRARAQARAVTSPDAQPEATTAAVDDPARSPYPIWQPQQAYREGYKVVWHGAVYQARWFTQAQTPDVAPTATGNDPWLLVGPVLRSDRAPEIPKLAPGTHPAWGPRHVYRAGAEVLYRGLPYRASWYTVGDVPGESPADGSPSAWQPLYRIPGEPAAATG